MPRTAALKMFDLPRGKLDSASWPSIRGWAYDPAQPGRPVLLDLWQGDLLLKRFAAGAFRPDLAAAGMGDGHHAFDTALSPDLFEDASVELQIRLAGSGIELEGSPVQLARTPPGLDRRVLNAAGDAAGILTDTARRPASLDALRRLMLRHFDTVCARLPIDVTPPVPAAYQNAAAQMPRLAMDAVADPDVSIIISPGLSHPGAFADTHRCVAAILRDLPSIGCEILVLSAGVDAQSVLAGLSFSGGIRLLRHDAASSAAALPTAVAAARGRALMLLDNTAEPLPGWLDELHGTLAGDPAIGIVGPALIDPYGLLLAVGGNDDGSFRGADLSVDDPAHRHMTDVAFVPDAALLVRTELFTANGLSGQGGRIVVQPKARIVLHTLRPAPPPGPRPTRPSALIIDDTTPKPDYDAGSNAVLEHMRSLQRLGYDVHFIPTIDMLRIGGYTDALERMGVRCYAAPEFHSAEEVFRRIRTQFAVIMVHRVGNADRYSSIVRQHQPQARLIYSVVDLHFLRAERQAALLDDPALARDAARTKRLEVGAVESADCTVVYSSHEAELLRTLAPDASVHVVPWAVRPGPTGLPFADRRGLAFVGGYAHAPNVDAAEWLVQRIMPLVWAGDPEIELTLVGSAMPQRVRDLVGPRVTALGFVPDLDGLLGQVRLTVAPLRYGAGLKGKVLSSLAAGVPCVGTSCAFEGMALPDVLQAASADTAEALAGIVLGLYANEALHDRTAAAGRQFIADSFSAAALDQLMRQAVGPGDAA